MKRFRFFNPYTNQLIKDYEFTSIEKLNEVLRNSEKGFKSISSMTIAERNQKMLNLAKVLDSKKEQLGTLIT